MTASSTEEVYGIAPHGGKLINRQVQGDERAAALARARTLLQIRLSPVSASDVYMIAIGAYSPLTGFMNRSDYTSVLKEMRLANGLVWTIPITLPVCDELAGKIKKEQEVALVDGTNILALMRVTQKFPYDKKLEARQVYQTTDAKHPSVAQLYRQGNTLLSGEITLINEIRFEKGLHIYRETPRQTRLFFSRMGWETIAGFQTRNPLHRAHEAILKRTLQETDGLLIHALAGKTQASEIPIQARFESYNVVLHHYPPRRIGLSAFLGAMRYAGPREALFHALCRKNYGCTHFIVGRNHAGIGNYYSPLEAQQIFSEFHPAEIGIIPLFFTPYFCHTCQETFPRDTCPPEHTRHDISGTEIRAMLTHGQQPPNEMMRPEVSKVLMRAYGIQANRNNHRSALPPSQEIKNSLIENLLEDTKDPITRFIDKHFSTTASDLRPRHQ